MNFRPTLQARRPLYGLVLGIAASLMACQQSGSEERCDAIAGDLVISELMVDPEGADENQEWFEIYNASSRGIVLEGLIIERISRTANEEGGFDDISKARHALRTSQILSSGAYFVLGDADAIVAPLDYSYDERDSSGRRLGANFGALPKTPSGLILSCAGREIDRVVWGDDERELPESGVALSLDGASTPNSVVNDDFSRWCPATEPYDELGNLGSPGEANLPCGVSTCDDDIGTRETVPPSVGDLVVSEVYADPAGADSGKEWLEIASNRSEATDLNQVVVRITKTESGSVATYPIESDACISLLPNQRIVLGASNDLVTNGTVDVGVVVDGFSLYNSAELLIEILHLDNVIASTVVPASQEGASWAQVDDGWCLSRAKGLFEGAGTPGVANTCGATCYVESDDVWRVTREPVPGDLLITEILADPAGADGGKEFIELVHRGADSVDLNGLKLSVVANEPDATIREFEIGGEACVSVETADIVVLASETESSLNGGLFNAVLIDGLSLLNSKPLVVSLAGVDEIDSTVVPIAQSGKSWQLRPQNVVAGLNDDQDFYCISQSRAVASENLGTPGAENTCGFTCLDGTTVREVSLPELDELIVTEVFANPTGADAGRDWVELLHIGESSFDLNGLQIATSNGTSTKDWTLEAEQCLRVEPGDYKVIGGQGLSGEGIEPFVEIGSATDTLFYASNVTISVIREGLALDTVGPLTVSEGTSTQLNDGSLDATSNDNPLAWCVSSGLFPETPVGTPGTQNGTCQ